VRRAFPVGKIAEEAVECILDNMALYFDCRTNKNALLQTVFWRFCPLGLLKFCILESIKFEELICMIRIRIQFLASVISKIQCLPMLSRKSSV